MIEKTEDGGPAVIEKITVKSFGELPSYGTGPHCPICKTRRTKPTPGCWCPSELRWGVGSFTKHIMKNHHLCLFPKKFSIDADMDAMIAERGWGKGS
jgi:hypothetical protein